MSPASGECPGKWGPGLGASRALPCARPPLRARPALTLPTQRAPTQWMTATSCWLLATQHPKKALKVPTQQVPTQRAPTQRMTARQHPKKALCLHDMQCKRNHMTCNAKATKHPPPDMQCKHNALLAKHPTTEAKRQQCMKMRTRACRPGGLRLPPGSTRGSSTPRFWLRALGTQHNDNHKGMTCNHVVFVKSCTHTKNAGQ